MSTRARPSVALKRLHLCSELLKKMDGRSIYKRMHGIDAQSIDMKIAQPHLRVIAKESAHLVRASFFKIHGAAPRRSMGIREIRAKLAGVISRRAKVVVHDIEKHGQSDVVRRIDESLQRVGAAVGFVHRKERYTVITPAVIAVEGRNRHEFNMGDAKFTQIFQFRNCRIQGAFGCECAEMQFVDDCAG